MLTCYETFNTRCLCSNKSIYDDKGIRIIYKVAAWWEDVTCPKCLKLKDGDGVFICALTRRSNSLIYDRLCKSQNMSIIRFSIPYNKYGVTCPKCLKWMR